MQSSFWNNCISILQETRGYTMYLEKAYDRVSQELVHWYLENKRLPKNLITRARPTYKEETTIMNRVYEEVDRFGVNVDCI